MFHFKFPDIGEGITEGTLTKWLVQVGDEVKEGQDLAEVETDKMTTTIPSAASGKVHQLHVEEYGDLEVGKVFITIDDGSEDASSPTDAPASEIEESVAPTGETDQPEETVKMEIDQDAPEGERIEEEEAGVVGSLISSRDELPPSDEGQIKQDQTAKPKKALATPVARKLAKDLGVDIQAIAGTGPGGRVMKDDIRSFAEQSKAPAAKPAQADQQIAPTAAPSDANEKREPLTRIRQTISQKMMQSKDGLVHTTMIEEIDVSDLVAFREKMKPIVGEDIKLTYLPFIMKAIVLALKEFPVMNSSLDEEAKELIYKYNYNIGIATDTERGLVVPVIFDADQKSIIEIAQGIDELAELARNNELQLEQMRGGTFTITNYGAIGGSFGTPIINYPEVGILGIGRIQKKPVVKDDEIVIGHLLPLSLSIDHRMIDGAVGVRFIRFLEEALRSPELLLLRS